MTPERASELREEIYFTRDKECIETLVRVRNLIKEDNADAEIKRLMAVPILYSVWERAFSICTAITLRVVQSEYKSAADCPPHTRAFWLRKADFFKSFVSSIRDVIELEREDSAMQQNTGFKKRISKGAFSLSADVLTKLDEWHAKPLNHRVGCDDLVITYSNVNDAVVTTNAEAIGLADLPAYKALDLSRLSQLVGIRNGIGHGAILTPPGSRELDELTDYTERLIGQYVDVACEWITEFEMPHQ